MRICRDGFGRFGIIHGGRQIDQLFETEAEALEWADDNIDDQVTDGPNMLSEPLRYRAAEI